IHHLDVSFVHAVLWPAKNARSLFLHTEMSVITISLLAILRLLRMLKQQSRQKLRRRYHDD
ncbi:MAG: hypothetical protein PHE09_08930, partial [Oscillospiraceae bacterium]|nr:hypothetical protein [Oscillospiraceae bacterium]